MQAKILTPRSLPTHWLWRKVTNKCHLADALFQSQLDLLVRAYSMNWVKWESKPQPCHCKRHALTNGATQDLQRLWETQPSLVSQSGGLVCPIKHPVRLFCDRRTKDKGEIACASLLCVCCLPRSDNETAINLWPSNGLFLWFLLRIGNPVYFLMRTALLSRKQCE